MALVTGYDTTNRAYLYSVLGEAYITNDFNAHKTLLAPQDTSYNTGISGPSGAIGSPTQSAGSMTAGDHLFRYRYQDSTNGYVSNPSDNLTVTIASGGEQAVFTIATGGDIIPSTDGRVDTVVLEATPKSSNDWFVMGKALNTATSITANSSDTTLKQQDSVQALWGGQADVNSFGHNAPPTVAFGVEHKGLHIVGGGIDRAYTSVTFTQSSQSLSTVTGQQFSSEWVGGTRMVVVTTASFVSLVTTFTSGTAASMRNEWTAATTTRSCTIVAWKPNRIYWALAGYPNAFDTTKRARDVLVGKNDVLKAVKSYRDWLVLAGTKTLAYLAWSLSPAAGDGVENPLPGTRGALNQNCLVEAEGMLLGFDRRGIWLLVGERPLDISDSIETMLEVDVQWSQSSKFFIDYDPVTKVVMAHFVKTGETEPRYAFAADIETLRGGNPRWAIYEWQMPLTASTLARQASNAVRLVYGDANGYHWTYGEQGAFDGVADGAAFYNAHTGSTTTAVVVSESIATSVDLVGTYLYDEGEDESRLITSHTTGSNPTINVQTAFTTAPAQGDNLYAGMINFEWRTKFFPGQDPLSKKRFTHLFLHIVPQSSGRGRVYFYADLDETNALTYTESVSDTSPKGVYIGDGDTYAEFDLDTTDTSDQDGNDGHLAIPIPHDWRRSIQAHVRILRPQGTVRILDMRFGVLGESLKAEE